MSAVQVNDAKGKPLGKVRIDDTKLEALERLSLSFGKGNLFDREEVALLDDERITAEGAPYVFKPAQPQEAHMGQPPPLTTQARFRNLLKSSGVTATEGMMGVILKHFASSANLVDTPEQARDLYFEASLLPCSATRIALQEQGISVADIFRGSDPSRGILLHAHENGVPRILKIATEKSILHECEVWSAVEATNQQKNVYLVPVKKLLFESALVEIGDMSGGSSTHPGARCGILMKHYQGTLSQCKIPLTVEVLLRYGKYLYKAVSTLHQAGYCHLDIKPSNIFLFEGACYLGDYGAATKTGYPIHERTIKYYPKDGDFEATEETDMYLLAATLLEMFGAIPQASQRNESFTKQEICDYIAAVENKDVRDFLSSFFIHK